MSILNEFFKTRRVLITGHTGFVGSWAVHWLKRFGAQVYGYGQAPPTQPSLFNEAKTAQLLSGELRGDVADFDRLHGFVEQTDPEIVLHLAAQPLVRLSYDQPRETYVTNVIGTLNLLESVRHAPSVKACQVFTTDKCYDNREWLHSYRETDPLGGHDPYSSSKACAELVVGAYRKSYFNHNGSPSLSSIRAGNVIGGGDWAADRLIPDWVRALEQEKSASIRNPGAFRPWQHVLEPLYGTFLLAMRQHQEPTRFSTAFNFGPDPTRPVSVGEVGSIIQRVWNPTVVNPADKERGSTHAPHEANYLSLDSTKAALELGWAPTFTAREGVGRAIKWYKQRHVEGAHFDAAKACAQDIEYFEQRAAAVAE